MPETNRQLTPDMGPIQDRSFSSPIAFQLHQSFQASQALQQEAETVLEAHEQAIAEYGQALSQPNWSPFLSLPAGTEARDLANGERLFVLPDGVYLQTTPGQFYLFVNESGIPHQLTEKDGTVTLPDGRAFELELNARATHDLEWIQGLPAETEPTLVDEGHYRLVFPSGIRLEVSIVQKTAVLIDPNGSVLVLGPDLRAFADELEVNVISNGGRGFAAKRAKHRGFVETNGDILLSLATGEDLVIHFPEIGTEPDDAKQAPNRYYTCGEPV